MEHFTKSGQEPTIIENKPILWLLASFGEVENTSTSTRDIEKLPLRNSAVFLTLCGRAAGRFMSSGRRGCAILASDTNGELPAGRHARLVPRERSTEGGRCMTSGPHGQKAWSRRRFLQQTLSGVAGMGDLARVAIPAPRHGAERHPDGADDVGDAHHPGADVV